MILNLISKLIAPNGLMRNKKILGSHQRLVVFYQMKMNILFPIPMPTVHNNLMSNNDYPCIVAQPNLFDI